ncbi:MAG: hypothetical protein R3251_01480 [Candidatus Spechtbacterales bacterium]|nr:hypothetical protein [Candidatus Spechtbacterales bacterium]
MNDQLQNYIKQMHEQGFDDARVRRELKKAGWSEEDINKELGKPASQNTQKSAPKSPKQGLAITFVVILALLFSFGTLGAYFYLQDEEPQRVGTYTETKEQNDKINTNDANIDEMNEAPAPSTEKLEVISPNGGEEFCMGQPIRIRWTAPKNVNTVNLYQIRNGSEILIATVPVQESQHERLGYGLYSWKPTSTLPGINYYIKISTQLKGGRGSTYFSDDRSNAFRIIDCDKENEDIVNEVSYSATLYMEGDTVFRSDVEGAQGNSPQILWVFLRSDGSRRFRKVATYETSYRPYFNDWSEVYLEAVVNGEYEKISNTINNPIYTQ